MSAFMVEDKTINRIASKVYYRDDYLYIREELKELDINNAEEFGEAMFILNQQGVNSRYGDNEAEKFRPLNYKYVPEYNLQLITIFKGLESLVYQCSEGDTIEKPLYKLLIKLELSMAKNIIWDMESYKIEKWA